MHTLANTATEYTIHCAVLQKLQFYYPHGTHGHHGYMLAYLFQREETGKIEGVS